MTFIEARRSLRTAGGRWADSNLGAFVDGARSEQVKRWIVEAPELAEFTSAIAADLGGPENLSTLARECVAGVAFKILLRRHSVQPALAEGGALTGRDRRRSALETYLRLDDAIRKDMAMLTLDRKPKPVQSLADVLAQHEEHLT